MADVKPNGLGDRLLAWCRRYPVVAALLACNLMMFASMVFTAAYWGSQIVQLQRENDALRQEIKTLRGDPEAREEP